MSRKKPVLRGAVLGAVGLMLALVGCTTVSTTSPASARDGAGSEPLGAGAVDCRVAKCIALTFDAGPGRDTPELLDLLRREHVPATFFLLGEKHVARHPQTVRRIAAEGHEVANHTWSHPRLTDLDADRIRQELGRTQDAIAELTGRRPVLMRPPQGRTDDEVARVCRELGLSQVLWSTTARDFATHDPEVIAERTLEQAGRDGVILLHDIYPGTVPAVPRIVSELRQRGYTFVTVSQLLAPATPVPGKVYKP